MDKTDKISFFSKLFQNKKSSRTPSCKWMLSDHSKGWSPPNFNQEHVRLTVILQSPNPYEGGKVLFDSKSEASKVSASTVDGKKRFACKSPCSSKGLPGRGQQLSDGPTSRERRPRLASDIKALEEIMFGSAPTIPKASTLKVHTVRNPPQLMVTKVFLPTPARESNVEQEIFDLYSIQSINVDSPPRQITSSDKNAMSLAQSVPMNVPLPTRGSSEDTEDSGFSASMASSCSSSFTTSGYSPSSSASMNSLNSLTRRLLRSQTTSLEYSLNKRNSDDHCVMPVSQRPSRLGILITFIQPEENMENFKLFESFFFSHITLIESHVVKLKVAVEKALQKQNKHMVVEALDVFRCAVFDLYTAPRLSEPVWLNMMCQTRRKVALCQSFLKEFMSTLDKYDTKNTKFFVSTLVTAVLTHHLAWVPTVTPAGAFPSRTYLDKHSAKWLDALARSHPYNPLWAQLGDLYGAIGHPLRLSRTVITGQKADLVCKFLHVLSYFIRCSEIHEVSVNRENLDYIDGHIDIPGSGMNTIEEDDISEGGDNISYGRRYGSATSYGTVCHASMINSTETVLSGRSEGTYNEKTDIWRTPTSPRNRTPVNDNPINVLRPGLASYQPSLQECQCEGNEICDTNLDFCEGCQSVKSNRDTLHKETVDWKFGNSVFYCCLDVIEGNENSECTCNFDLVKKEVDRGSTIQSESLDSPTKSTSNSNLSEVLSAENDTAGIEVRGLENPDSSGLYDNENEGVHGETEIPTSVCKPLLLFRMLSKDHTSNVNECESSFCDDPISDNYLNPDTDIEIHNVKLKKTHPKDLFDLHVDTSPNSSLLNSSHNDDENLCKLFPDIDVEVKLQRVRHVGRDAETSGAALSPCPQEFSPEVSENFTNSKDPANNFVNSDNTNSASASADAFLASSSHSSEHSSSDNLCIESDSHDNQMMQSTETIVNGKGSSLSDEYSHKYELSEHIVGESRKPSKRHDLIDCNASCSSSTSSESTKLSSSSIYPSLTTLLGPGPSESVDKVMYKHIASENNLTDVHGELVQVVSKEHEEPGSVQLYQANLGTLYPVIEGNTVIASTENIRKISSGKPYGIEPTINHPLADVTDSHDDVFISEHQNRSDSCDIRCEGHEKSLGSRISVSSCNSSKCDDNNLPPIISEPERDISQSTGLTKNINSRQCPQDSPSHAKVSAWLVNQSEGSSSDDDDFHRSPPMTSTINDDSQEIQKLDSASVKENPECINTGLVGKAPCTPSRRIKVPLLERSSSIFDEYFADDSVELPQYEELNKSVSEISDHRTNLVHDKDKVSHDVQQASGRREGPVGLHHEYFAEEMDPLSVPNGSTKDMNTGTVLLMQESIGQLPDDINMSEILEPKVARSRSSSGDSGGKVQQKGRQRQLSGGSMSGKPNSQPTATPARCRSVTPTELGRRRHTSSTTTVSWELEPPSDASKNGIKEIPMPRTTSDVADDGEETTVDCNFGRSLLAGYTDHYMSDFVLHGTSDNINNFLPRLHTDLNIAVQNSLLDEPITEACCIVADTDKWNVRLHTCQHSMPDRMKNPMDLGASQMVTNILESVHKLWKLKMSPEFCLMHLEDRLQEIYFKSKMLSEYVHIHSMHGKIDLKELSTALGFAVCDLPLLLAVAGTHSPQTNFYIGEYALR